MSLPGPPGTLWALSLLVWGGAAAVVGEAVRGPIARWVPFWGGLEPLERLLLDFYLGGATMYLLAAIEVGAFDRPVVVALPVVGAAAVLYRVGVLRRSGEALAAATRFVRPLFGRWALVTLASALGLYLVEIAAALPVATGNTYDASLLTTYVAILLRHGNLPLSFGPYASSAILYPQGATVWLGWAQLDFGLPPSRTSLLVTPLFLALTPLGGYVMGRQWVGTPRAGATFALAVAWLGPATRSLVGGSNDFAFALPLVLLLAARTTIWTVRPPPRPGDSVGFGVLLGYAAAMNIVGTEWLLLAMVVLGGFAVPAFGGRVVAWFGRWAVAVTCALVAGIPPLYVLVRARVEPSTLAGALTVPPGTPVGISLAQFLGSIDPFLFRAGDVELSPIPFVRLELAVLLVLGIAVLLWRESERPGQDRWSAFSRWALASGVAIVAWLALMLAAGVPGSPLRSLAFVSSSAELSLSLFTVYGLVAAVPLGVALDRLGPAPSEPAPPPRTRRRSERSAAVSLAPVAFAAIVLVPAVVLTPTSLGPVLSGTYADFSNVSAADFALLAYAGTHVPPGTRVLVAPGSVGEFLPGYATGIVLLYPMEPGWERVNASYRLVLDELTNGTLDAVGLRALASLAVNVIVVTGNNTVLWPALWASPLLRAETNSTPTFPVLFHDADAWLFNASACRPGSAGCP